MGCKQLSEAKLHLLQYVRRCSTKPLPGNRARWNFENFCRTNSRSYDPFVRKQVISLRPIWFIKSSDIKKNLILTIAHGGGDKPSQRTPLGASLRSYYYKACSGSYDYEFAHTVREIRPDWFIPEKWLLIQKLLLKMAKAGKPKPSQATKLGAYLHRFVNKGNRAHLFFPAFKGQIKRIRPDWFK